MKAVNACMFWGHELLNKHLSSLGHYVVTLPPSNICHKEELDQNAYKVLLFQFLNELNGGSFSYCYYCLLRWTFIKSILFVEQIGTLHRITLHRITKRIKTQEKLTIIIYIPWPKCQKM